MIDYSNWLKAQFIKPILNRYQIHNDSLVEDIIDKIYQKPSSKSKTLYEYVLGVVNSCIDPAVDYPKARSTEEYYRDYEFADFLGFYSGQQSDNNNRTQEYHDLINWLADRVEGITYGVYQAEVGSWDAEAEEIFKDIWKVSVSLGIDHLPINIHLGMGKSYKVAFNYMAMLSKSEVNMRNNLRQPDNLVLGCGQVMHVFNAFKITEENADTLIQLFTEKKLPLGKDKTTIIIGKEPWFANVPSIVKVVTALSNLGHPDDIEVAWISDAGLALGRAGFGTATSKDAFDDMRSFIRDAIRQHKIYGNVIPPIQNVKNLTNIIRTVKNNEADFKLGNQ